MSKQFDITTIGECLVEFTCEEENRYIQSFAGDVYNTLFYGSRLGLRTKFLSCFGEDQFTNDIFQLSFEESIDLSSCKVLQDRRNGLYMVEKDENGKPLFSFWRKNSAATRTFVELGDHEIIEHILSSKVFLLSFIPIAILHEPKRLFNILEEVKGKTLIYCDMNIRRSLWEDPQHVRFWLGMLAEYIDILSLSYDDHTYISRDPTSVQWYQELGYKKILLRDEANPVKYFFDGIDGKVPTFKPTSIVDSTGAGDAFNAGCIYGLLHNYTTENAIRLGNASAAIAITGKGGITKNYSRDDVMKIYNSQ